MTDEEKLEKRKKMKIGVWDSIALGVQPKNKFKRFLQTMAILAGVCAIGLSVTFVISTIARLL